MKNLYTFLIGVFISCTAMAQPAGWSYTQVFQVTNNTATQVTDYQLALTFDSQTLISLGQMNANGDDIRFGDDCNGTNLFNYWIESGINTTSTLVWVKIDTLPASGTMQLFMYYGNASASAVSAIPGTFIGPHSSTDSTSGANTGGVTNSQRGFRFAPTEDILMTAVGKNEPNGTTRYVTLFNYSTQAILRQHQVSGPAAQFSYSNMPQPIWLTSGTQYLLEIFQGASDGYYFGAPPNSGQHLTYLDMRYCNGCTQNTFPTNSLGGMHYGYVDMWYFTKLSVATPPTITTAGPLSSTASANGTICAGDSVQISISAAGGALPYSYSWSPAGGLGNPFAATTNASPASTQGYTVTVTDGCGSTSTGSGTITVNQLPAVVAGVSSDSVCSGGSFTPMGSGASTYVWTGGLTDNVAFTPVSTNTYTVTGTDGNGCSATAIATVEVLPLPAVTASANNTTVCAGDMVTFNGGGAATYVWDNGVTDNVPSALSMSAMYHVTGTDIYGCTNWDSVYVTVNPVPPVVASVAGSPICSGGSVTLTANGADTYVWNPGSITGNGITVTPASGTTYTVTGTDTLTGCSNVDSVLVDVHQNPFIVTTSDTSCSTACGQLNAVVTGNAPFTYLWVPSAGLNNTTIANPVSCMTITQCYTVMVTDANGCTDAQLACNFVNSTPNVSATGPTAVCVTDGSYTLTGTPAGGLFSGPGITGNTFSPATAGNGTHQVVYSYTDANGCGATDTVSIVVSPCVGIADNNANDGIDVFPNPFGTQLIINLNEAAHVRMFNNLGQVVFEQELNSGRNEIGTSEFAVGVYTMEVVNANGTSVIKVVKQ